MPPFSREPNVGLVREGKGSKGKRREYDDSYHFLDPHQPTDLSVPRLIPVVLITGTFFLRVAVRARQKGARGRTQFEADAVKAPGS